MPTYRVDLHSHCAGDPIDDLPHSIEQHIDRAAAVGLHAIALTWHQRIFDNTAAIEYAKERGVLLIPGAELELNGRMHTLALNIAPGDIPTLPSLAELRALRERPDVFIIAPHPYYPLGSCLGSVIDEHPDLFDGVEWSHYHFPWIPAPLNPNERARRWAQRNHKPLIACSDAHDLGSVGRFFSEVEAEELTIPALFTALRAGRVKFTPQAMSVAYTAQRTWAIGSGMILDLAGRHWRASQKSLDREQDAR